MIPMFDLARWSPFGMLGTPFRLHREIDDLFSRFFGQPAGVAAESAVTAWWPAVESWTSDGTLHVRVALPGVEPKDVEVSVTDNVLTIKGERKHRSESRDGSYFLRELGYGAFERSLVLPEGVDPAKVTAKYTNGMLEIALPAPLAVAPKKVEIQVESQSGTPKAIRAA
jgi:HSP20 family protein